jgi:DNA end-binding protein Ku
VKPDDRRNRDGHQIRAAYPRATQNQFHDTFTEEVMRLVDEKVAAGQTETVIQPEAEETEVRASNIVDLTELLQRSLKRGKGGRGAKAKPSGRRKAA